MVQEFEGFTETWNREQLERAAARDAEFEAAFEKDLLAFANGDTAVVEGGMQEKSSLTQPTQQGVRNGATQSTGKALSTESSLGVRRDPPKVAFEDQQLDEKDLYGELYEFPVDLAEKRTDLETMSVVDLAHALLDLSTEMTGKGQLRAYHEIRADVCAISIELNRRGKLAPRFRDMRRPPFKVKTVNERNLSRDRQVIDLHWLYCTGRKRVIESDHLHLRKLLLAPSFSLEHAEMFAQVPAPSNEKAGWLALPDHVAFQLATIQTEAVRQRFRVADAGDIREGKMVQRGRRQIVQALEASVANQPHLQGQVRRWAMIWMCSRLVGDNAEVLRGFHAVAEGLEKPLDRRDIVRRLAGVERRLGEVRAHGKIAA